jgi:2-polyprenyl-6-methoxyphenol hydroxylase-like FAD-dependent oxidoreductase
MSQRILIVGGGIAGLTAAAAFAQRGAEVDLVERKPELADSGGIGLSLVANAMRALATIGAAEACVAAGIPADSLAMCRPDGAVMAEQPLPRIGGPQWPGATGIRRSEIHRILAETALGAGTRVRCATTVSDWQDGPDGIDVEFSDGSNGRYDLLVAAEGLYSATRTKLMPGIEPQFTGQVVWRCPAPRPADLLTTRLHFGGRHGVVGICPIAEDLSYIYIVEAAAENTLRDEATLDAEMRDRLEGYGGMVAELAATIDRPEKVSFRPIEWILAPRPWGAGRVVMIGDAVHANPPVLAQGAALGIEDAVVLAEEVASAPGDIPGALTLFLDRRYARVEAVVTASCELARAEVEHRHDLDVPGIMRANSQMLAQPL